MVVDTQVSVSLTSPSDTYETNDTTPSFTWTGDGETYTFQISTSASFGTIYDSKSTGGLTYTPSPGYATDTYYWRVAAKDTAGNYETAAARRLKIDLGVNVSLTSPSDGHETKNVIPTFGWSGDGDTYTIQISKSSAFATIHDSQTTTGVSYTPGSIYPADTYYWRVSAQDNAGNSNTTGSRTLYVDTAVSVSLALPADGHETKNTTPGFVWTGDGDTYVVQVTKQGTLYDSKTTTTLSYTPAAVYPTDTYQWRVIAQDDAGNYETTGYRSVWLDTLVTVSLALPADGTETRNATVRLEWTGDGDTYEVQVSKDSNFGAMYDSKTTGGLSYTSVSVYPQDTYYWRVSARDDAGNQETTVGRTLVVDTSVSVSQTSPGDSAETNDTTPAFTWSGTGDTYTVQVSKLSTFATIHDVATVTSATYTPSPGYAPAVYYWRVVGWDDAGNYETTVLRRVVVDTQVSVSLTSPSDTYETNDTTPSFTWTGDGETYTFQISTSTSFGTIYDSQSTGGLGYTPSPGYATDTYYWRVVAKDTAGNYETTVLRRVVVDTQVSVSLTSPSDTYETNDTTPSFTWTGDGETYTFQISTSTSFGTIYDSQSTGGLGYTPSPGYATDTYYWRVVAKDTAGNYETTAARMIKVDTIVSVSLTAPSDSAETNDTTLTFTWSGTGDTYTIQIAKVSTFAVLYEASTTNGTSYSPSSSYGADTYFWRVIAGDKAGNFETSASRFLLIDTIVTVSLTSPADTTRTNDTTPAFAWSGTGDTYQIQISMSGTFGTLRDSTSTAALTYTPSGYPEDTYYWRVIAWDEAGNFETTAVRMIVLDTSVTVSVTSPADSTRTNDTTPAFSWSGAGDTYVFQISKQAAFGALADSLTSSAVTYTPSTGYAAETYYWRVAAIDAAGNHETSASRVLYLDTGVTVSQTSPEDSTKTSDTMPTFTWSGDGDTYTLQVSKTAGFGAIFDSQTTGGATYTPAAYYAADTYYWRVVVADQAGNTGVTSVRLLIIDTAVSVSLSTPAEGAETNDTTPSFTWSGNGDTYTIQISKSSAFGSIFDSKTTSSVTYTPSGGYPADTYYWRVTAGTISGNHDTTVSRVLVIDTGVTVSLASPADSAETNDTTPTFTWSGTGDTYTLQVSKAGDFAAMVDSKTTSSTTYAPSSGYGADTYFWRVIASDDAGNHETAAARALVIDTSVTVSLASPVDSAETNDTTPTFAWSGTGDTYTLQVSKSGGFGTVVDSKTTSSTTYTPAGGYAADTYFWRVIASDDAGNFETPAARVLFIDTCVTVSQTSPVDSAETNDTTPTFTWSGTGDTYTLQVSKAGGFGTVVDSKTTASLTYTPAGGYGADTYFWRVVALDDAGNYETSAARVLVIDTGVTVSLANPSDSAETNDTTPTFTWSGTGDTYTIQVSKSGGFGTVVDSKTTASLTYTSSGGYGADTYFWRVIASDDAGNFETSAARALFIDTGVTVSQASPPDSAETNDTTPTFTWSGTGDTYTIQVSKSSAFGALADSATTGAVTYTPAAGYPADTYFWRVIASTSAGSYDTSLVRLLVVDTSIAVSLTSPSDSAETNDPTPTFTWSGTGDTYTLQVSKTAGFGTLVDSKTPAALAYTPTTGYSADTYFWRVIASDDAGNHETSAARALFIDTGVTVSLATPADTTGTNDTTPTFTWNGTGDTYALQVSKSSAFGVLVDSKTTASLTYTPAGGYAADTYFWRVIASDDAGNFETSAARALFIDTGVTVSQTSPADSVETNDTTPTFTWNGTGDTYTLQVSKTAGFGTVVDSKTTTAVTYTPSSGYGSDTYYWRVTAQDAAGNAETSAARALVIDTAVTVALASPSDSATTTDSFQKLTWSGTGDTYTVQVARDSLFVTMVDSKVTSGTSHTPLNGFVANTYYWRVGAQDRSGNVETTAYRTFRVDSGAPPVVQITAPDSGVITDSLTITIKGTVLATFDTPTSVLFRINGVDVTDTAPVDSMGAFMTTRTFTGTGTQTITARAVGASGFAGEDTRAIVIDTSPPTAKFKSRKPVDTDVVTTLTAEVRSYVPIATLMITQNSDTATGLAVGADSRIFSATATVPLVKGQNRFILKAMDTTGRLLMDTYDIYKVDYMMVAGNGAPITFPELSQYDTWRGAVYFSDTVMTMISTPVYDSTKKAYGDKLAVDLQPSNVGSLFTIQRAGNSKDLKLGTDDRITRMRFTAFEINLYTETGADVGSERSAFGAVRLLWKPASGSDLAGLPLSAMKFHTLNEATGGWEAVTGSAWDAGQNAVIGAPFHFSFYAVFPDTGKLAASDLSKVIVYPNPYIPYDGIDENGKPPLPGDFTTGIIVDNISADITVRVFTVAGRELFNRKVTGAGRFQWDLSTIDPIGGQMVASGVYLMVITDNKTGQRVTKKVAIIK
ncbi:MAG: hypothetical protein A3I06_02050 [Candidatus Lindowbacteria bacterium RIFCSPLOWO2_02_FULL_62_12]|nr:MAG: hypothetical protein A3I06_02050 [Candidatus Lindowbacteria bacterium RIFCSPLOWO2_02_FULL_62_12]